MADQASQRAWRIIAVEDRMLILESFGEPTQVDLSRAKWEKYCDKAAEVLSAMVEREQSTRVEWLRNLIDEGHFGQWRG